MNAGQVCSPSPEQIAKMDKLREIRNKPWEEATDSEKIEKLKMVVEDFNYVTSRVANLETEIHRLKLHSHSEKGDLVIPLSSVNNLGGNGLLSASTRNTLA